MEVRSNKIGNDNQEATGITSDSLQKQDEKRTRTRGRLESLRQRIDLQNFTDWDLTDWDRADSSLIDWGRSDLDSSGDAHHAVPCWWQLRSKEPAK